MDHNVLLYDGDCAFCRDWAEWLVRHDSNRRLLITPWQHAPSPPMTPLLAVQAQKAVQLITRDGTHYSGGRAILAALKEIGWHPHLASLLARRPLVWPIEAGYHTVANNRHRFS